MSDVQLLEQLTCLVSFLQKFYSFWENEKELDNIGCVSWLLRLLLFLFFVKVDKILFISIRVAIDDWYVEMLVEFNKFIANTFLVTTLEVKVAQTSVRDTRDIISINNSFDNFDLLVSELED